MGTLIAILARVWHTRRVVKALRILSTVSDWQSILTSSSTTERLLPTVPNLKLLVNGGKVLVQHIDGEEISSTALMEIISPLAQMVFEHERDVAELKRVGGSGLQRGDLVVLDGEGNVQRGDSRGRGSGGGESDQRPGGLFFSQGATGSTNEVTQMNLSDAFKSLVELAKNDALKNALPPLATFFTNIAANPSGTNIVVEAAKLQLALLSALPTVEKDLFQAIAQMINDSAASLPK